MNRKDRILIADDEAEIRSLIRLYLENEGYEVLEASDGPEALEKAEREKPDLILLDIMMPRMDGFHVLQKIREHSNIPVIIISAKDQDPEKILGLNLGADDYMVKPFNPLEAAARVRSNLRRYHMMTPGEESSEKESIYVRDLELIPSACMLKKGDREIPLTAVELKVMELFMRNPGKVFTKQQIYECGWGDLYVVADNNIMVCISKLRAKLDEENPYAYIRTIRGLGYRLEKNG